MSNTDDVKRIQQALAEPFTPQQLGWKPQTVSGSRCLAIPYIDARDVMNRLDRTVGVGGWQDTYEVLDGHEVRCRLSVRISGEWITKEDVGGESEQKDDGDRRKAAFSDALKRAAVKWGIGRYLYYLPAFWADYDPRKKEITVLPELPSWAQPKPADGAADKRQSALQQPKQPAAPKDGPPSTEKSLAQRLEEWSASADAAGLDPAGGLIADAVATFCVRPGWGDDYRAWPPAAADAVITWAKQRYGELVGPLPATAEQQKELLAALAARSETWQKLASKLKWPPRHAVNALTRAQFAAGMKALEAVPDKTAKGSKGAA